MTTEPSSNVKYLPLFGIIYLYHSGTNYTDRRHKTFATLCMKMKIGEGEAELPANTYTYNCDIQGVS
jgi:hypothetical protein